MGCCSSTPVESSRRAEKKGQKKVLLTDEDKEAGPSSERRESTIPGDKVKIEDEDTGDGPADADCEQPEIRLPLEGYCRHPVLLRSSTWSRSQEYKFYWQKSKCGSTTWEDMTEGRPVPQPYTPSVDDMNCNLRIVIQPSSGPAEYSNLCFVTLHRTMFNSVIRHAGAGTATFTAEERDATGKTTDWQLYLDNTGCTVLKRSTDKKNKYKKVDSVKWAGNITCVPNPADDRSFIVQYSGKGHTLTASDECRDTLITTFRVFHGLSTEDICLELCGPEFAQYWKKGKMKKTPAPDMLTAGLRTGDTANIPVRHLSAGYDAARDAVIACKFAAMA
eukprot:TRINITY_DN86684_c0_g1_i1.p1 TRINITY_DN86684_c0_g1~~TRINITY_DN86684_c0_g1_i1.p1  ORF type:complete len:333 (-),score=34.44 TRINITY_DN86684_c0_g1_i1:24-1022(-)